MTSTVSSSSDSVRGALPGSGVPGSRVAPAGDEPALREWASELVERARADGVELTGENGLLTALVRQVLQTGLEVEMTDHLGYEPHAVDGRGTGNSRNGSYPKTVTTEVGQVRLRVPRDRNASFDPVTVPKGQRRLDGLTGNVVSLYAKGMTTGDIQAHLADTYLPWPRKPLWSFGPPWVRIPLPPSKALRPGPADRSGRACRPPSSCHRCGWRSSGRRRRRASRPSRAGASHRC